MLYHFLSETKLFVYGCEHFMPLEDFRELYFEYRRENGVDRIRWAPSHYGAHFEDLFLIVLPIQERRVYNGVEMMKKWVLGVVPYAMEKKRLQQAHRENGQHALADGRLLLILKGLGAIGMPVELREKISDLAFFSSGYDLIDPRCF